MSYDLQLLPRSGEPLDRTEVREAIARHAPERPTSQAPGTFEVPFGTDTVVVDLETDDSDVVTAISVSASWHASDGDVRSIYRFCAAVAEELGCEIYDPQGDARITPKGLVAASSGRLSLRDPEILFGAVSVASAVLVLGVGGVWWFVLGKPRSPAWMASLLSLMAIHFVSRWLAKRAGGG